MPSGAGRRNDSLNRLLQILEEHAGGQILLAGEEPFVTGVHVRDPGIHQERVAGELAIGFRVRIGLRSQFAELRTADGPGRAETQLLVFRKVPRRRERWQIVLLVDLGRSEGRGPAEQVTGRDRLLAVFKAHAIGGANQGNDLGVHLDIGGRDLDLGRIGGRTAAGTAGDFRQEQAGRPDVDVRVEIVDPRPALFFRQGAGGHELQVAALGVTIVVRISHTEAEDGIPIIGQRGGVADVCPAGDDIVFQFAEGDPVAADLMQEGTVCGDTVLETRLVGRIAFGQRIGTAPGDFQGTVHQLMLAGQLGGEQLAFEPFGVVAPLDRATGVEIGTGADPRFLGDVAHEEIGPAIVAVVRDQRQAAEEVQLDVVLVRLKGLARDGHEDGTGELGLFLHAVPRRPAVAVAGHADQAEGAEAAVGLEATGEIKAEIHRRHFALQETQRRVDQRVADAFQFQRGHVGAVDRTAAREGEGQLPRNVAGAVVKTGEISARAEIDQALLTRGFGVAADRCRHREERIIGRIDRAQVDHPAAELTRKINRVGFLDGHTFEDAGRKQVQGNDTLQRLGAGERRAVQQGRRIALAEAAHVDEPALNDRQARHTGQGTGSAAVAGPLEVL